MADADPRTRAIYHAVGKILADLRKARGFTQEALADLTERRLSRSAIANIERGRQRVAVHHLLDLASALEVPPDELLPALEELPPLPKQAAQQLRDRVTKPRAARLLQREAEEQK